MLQPTQACPRLAANQARRQQQVRSLVQASQRIEKWRAERSSNRELHRRLARMLQPTQACPPLVANQARHQKRVRSLVQASQPIAKSRAGRSSNRKLHRRLARMLHQTQAGPPLATNRARHLQQQVQLAGAGVSADCEVARRALIQSEVSSATGADASADAGMPTACSQSGTSSAAGSLVGSGVSAVCEEVARRALIQSELHQRRAQVLQHDAGMPTACSQSGTSSATGSLVGAGVSADCEVARSALIQSGASSAAGADASSDCSQSGTSSANAGSLVGWSGVSADCESRTQSAHPIGGVISGGRRCFN